MARQEEDWWDFLAETETQEKSRCMKDARETWRELDIQNRRGKKPHGNID